MRIAVFGNFGVNNLGDDLILMGLMKEWHGHDLIVFCGRPEQIESQFGLQAFPFFPGGLRSGLRYMKSAEYRDEIRKASDALQSVNHIIIGGGGILVDQRLAAVILWERQLKKISSTGLPFHFLGNSFELKHWWSRGIFKKYLQQAEIISVRDKASQNFIRSLGLKAGLVDDFALQTLEPLQFVNAAPLVCLALCRSGVRNHELKVLRKFIQRCKDEHFQIVGLAFQTVGDDDREFYKKLDPTLQVFHGLDDILELLRYCQILVGMRFHSILMALHFGIPVVALAYQEKVSNLMADRGLSEQCIPIHNLDEQKLQGLFAKTVESL